MKTLPKNLTEYKRTPSFNAGNIPAGFLKEHSTKEGTWGLLTVESGSILYVIDDEGTHHGNREPYELEAGNQAVIAPQQPHHLESPSDDVEFYVRFFR